MMDFAVRTDDLPAGERFDYWRTLMSRSGAPMEIDTPRKDRFRAEMHSYFFGAVRIYRLTGTPCTVRRSARHIRQCDPELYQVSFSLRGKASVSHAGAETVLGPNEYVIHDSSRPFYGTSGPDGALTDGIGVVIPRALLPSPARHVERILGTRLPGSDPFGALLSEFVIRLSTSAQHSHPASRARLSTIVLDLLAATVAHELDAEPAFPPQTLSRALLVRIHAFIEQHLADPALSPATIAAAHHISLRYLHRLFHERDETVAAWIRSRRLARCQRDLADPALHAMPVHTIAQRWGFTSAAHFSRAFRAARGLSPTDYRHAARSTRESPPPQPDAAVPQRTAGFAGSHRQTP